jgi:hypothetical protein
MAHDLAAAMVAHRRQQVNGAFETVERMLPTGSDDLKRQMIVVAADFTLRHESLQK